MGYSLYCHKRLWLILHRPSTGFLTTRGKPMTYESNLGVNDDTKKQEPVKASDELKALEDEEGKSNLTARSLLPDILRIAVLLLELLM